MTAATKGGTKGYSAALMIGFVWLVCQKYAFFNNSFDKLMLSTSVVSIDTPLELQDDGKS